MMKKITQTAWHNERVGVMLKKVPLQEKKCVQTHFRCDTDIHTLHK